MVVYVYTLISIFSVVKRQAGNIKIKKSHDIIPIIPSCIVLFGAMFLDYFFIENFYFLLFLGVISYYGSIVNELTTLDS